MLARPNLVVGALGLAIAVITGTYIGANFKELTDIVIWRVDVASDSESLGQKSGYAPPGEETVVPFRVSHANVTRIQLRLTWLENMGPVAGERHEVTVTVRSPVGLVVAQSEPTTGGLRGITIDQDFRPTPEDARYEGTEDQFSSYFAREYPDHPEDDGVWNITIKTSEPERGTGISYTVDFSVEYYTALYEELGPAPTGGQK